MNLVSAFCEVFQVVLTFSLFLSSVFLSAFIIIGVPLALISHLSGLLAETSAQSEDARMSKNQILLGSFTAYCKAHPDERFWQALRNWCGWGFILVARNLRAVTDDTADTFYWEETKKP